LCLTSIALFVVAREQRTITIGKDADAFEQATKLDGCYVLKTDLAQTAASKGNHSRAI
jgi:hypothetical protein